MRTTVHILNKVQLWINNNKTFYELWYGKAPSVKYFKVFGSRCYIKKLDEKLGKFDARSDEGIFVGYASTKKAYICYNIRLHKIVESADVTVDDLKTKKVKHQKITLDNEDEEDEESVGVQAEEEENKENEGMEEEEMDISEDEQSTHEEVTREESLGRDTKTPSILVQKNHLEDQIIGSKSTKVQTRRQLLYQTEITCLS